MNRNRNRDRKKKPPVAGLVPTMKTPTGGEARRCQKKSRRSGKQCARPARRGYDACTMHGVGTRKREKAGTRQNVGVVNITTGAHAQDQTIAAWKGFDLRFKERLEHYASNPEKARDLDALVQRLWAVCDIIAEKPVDTVVDFMSGAEHPPVIVAVLTAMGQTLERMARIEGRIKDTNVTVTMPDLQLMVRKVVEVIHEFVPADRVADALRKLESAGALGPAGDGGAEAPRQA